jgi:hypothetical protein
VGESRIVSPTALASVSAYRDGAWVPLRDGANAPANRVAPSGLDSGHCDVTQSGGMADATGLNPEAERRAGSNPASATNYRC